MPEGALGGFLLGADWVIRPASAPGWLETGFGTRLSPEWGNGAFRLKQVHSDRIVTAGGGFESSPPPEADAAVTNQPGRMLAIRTADCLPILLADERTRTVAAVHAGWRGAAAGILAKTVAEMQRKFGARPEDLLAWFGPGIGKCCFEVGPEVAVQFPGFAIPAATPGKAMLDLGAACASELASVGVRADRLLRVPLCTRCESELFHSWRRDHEEAGRLASVIGIRQAG